ncbi:MAG: response regulator [Chloroflexota bacterium]
MTDKILLVDDEFALLESLRRELGFRYNIETALSGVEALEKITNKGPYAVIVTDYRMPHMDGIKFLTRVMEVAPDSIRMMLTGNADLPTAIDAINQGQLFRFLTKPCSGELFTKALDAALKQYHLVMAEKELLENTLTESVILLTEILSIVNPKAYGRSLRIQQLVSSIIKFLNLDNGWQYEMAASLSQLGWITFPPEMLRKIELNEPLSVTEALLFSKHPLTSKKLLEKIPRLEIVSQMIAGQNRSIDDLCFDPTYGDTCTIDMGSHILKVCIHYDQLLLQGLPHDQILAKMHANQNNYHPDILKALENLSSYKPTHELKRIEEVKLDELEIGMFLAESVRDKGGIVLFSAETFVTRSMLIKLLGMGTQNNQVSEPLKIIRNVKMDG